MGERPTLMRLPMALRPLTWLAARVYGVAVGWRNARLSKGIGVGEIRVRGVGIGVISVGNITVGGTGKSPFVAWICGEIARLGRRPVIGMRGYTPGLVRRNAGGSSMALLCDEAQEYALTAPMALVVAHPKRRRALNAELSREVHAPWIDGAVVVLDDGFQHRFVARALDIVLVDATRTGLDGDLLPNGILREPAGNLARADIVVLTKAHDPAQRARAEELVRVARGRGADAVCVHEWVGIEVHESGQSPREESVSWLAQRAVMTACGLGNPAHFEEMAGATGARIIARLRVGDHRAMRWSDLEAAGKDSGAQVIVMSRKDFVKLDATRELPAALSRGFVIVVPRLALRFIDGEARVRAAITAVTQLDPKLRDAGLRQSES